MVPMEERSPLSYKTGGTERCGAVHITARETCQGKAGRAGGQGPARITMGNQRPSFPWATGQVPGTWTQAKFILETANLGWSRAVRKRIEQTEQRQSDRLFCTQLGAPLSCPILSLSWALSRYHFLDQSRAVETGRRGALVEYLSAEWLMPPTLVVPDQQDSGCSSAATLA